MQPERLLIRVAGIGILLLVLFAVYLLYGLPGQGQSGWGWFVAGYGFCVLVMSHQALLALAGFLNSRGSTSPLVRALDLGGLRGTFWAIFRRRLAPRLRLLLLMLSWGIFLFGLIVILAWGRVLEDTELRLLNALSPGEQTHASSVVRILGLWTRDNNASSFYRSAAKVVREIRRAGAKQVLIEQPAYVEPAVVAACFPDSLVREFVIFYRSSPSPLTGSLPGLNPHPDFWANRDIISEYRKVPEKRPVVLGFRPVPSWYSQQLHVGLAALWRTRGGRDDTRPEFRDGFIQYGDVRPRVDQDGVAWVRVRPSWFPYSRTICDALTAEDSVLYTDRLGHSAPVFPEEGKEEIRDRIILLEWVDNGGTLSREQSRNAIPLATIIDALQRQRIVRNVEYWHYAVSALVLLLAALLALGQHGRYAAGAMIIVAVVLAAASVWLFAAQMTVVSFLYPVLAALLGGLVFPPLVFMHRNP